MGKISCIIASSVTLVSMEWSRCEMMQRNSTLTGKNENGKDKSKDKSKETKRKRKSKDKKKHHTTNLKDSKYHKG